MAKGKSSSATSTYSEATYVRNRERRLKRHCKNFPEDTAAAARLKEGSFKIRRKKPVASNGWVYSALRQVAKEVRALYTTKSDLVALAKSIKLTKTTTNAAGYQKEKPSKGK